MKIKTYLIWIFFAFGVLVFTGCTTVNTAANAQGSGGRVIYKASFDEVWAAMPEIITNAGLQYMGADTDKHVFLARRGITTWSWGENVAVFVEKVDSENTSVEVVTKRELETNITAKQWEGPILIQLDKRFRRD